MKVLFYLTLLLGLIPQIALAQITPDNSLGDENSTVETEGNKDTINGGATRGSNLFHSFEEFNVKNGREAYFANPQGIENIFNRVTGGNISNINGVLGVNGNANLYLMNPNGIIFGKGARLDVNGSFFATTSDSILFPNGVEFGATNPEAPPLLTIDIPVGLSFRDNPGNISVKNASLSLVDNQNLTIIGGNINLDSSAIFAPGGEVKLGGLLAAGEITISEDNSLTFPDEIARGDVAIINDALVNVSGNGGGEININAKNVSLVNRGKLFAGIAKDRGFVGAQAGDININVTNSVSLTGIDADGDDFPEDGLIEDNVETGIYNIVGTIPNPTIQPDSDNSNGIGNAGNINITSSRLEINDTARLSSQTYSQGNAGDINVNAEEVFLTNGSILNQAKQGLEINADGGDINITTNSLSLNNTGRIFANTIDSLGDAGKITINARDNIDLDINSEISSHVGIFRIDSIDRAVGNSRGVEINANNLNVLGGSRILANTFANGNAGKIAIDVVENLSIIGGSVIFSRVLENGVGNSGRIDITSKKINISFSSSISSEVLGKGNAGDVNIASSQIALFRNSNIFNRISTSPDLDFTSQGGDINIDTDSLSLDDNSAILADNTTGVGDVGKVTINAESNVNLNRLSSISSNVGLFDDQGKAIGDSRGVTINTKKLTLDNDSRLIANTFATGNSDGITINVSELLISNKSFIVSRVLSQADGDAKGIDIDTKILTLDNSQIFTDTEGATNAGVIDITAEESLEIIGIDGFISSGTGGTGNAGNININAPEIRILDDGGIRANNFRTRVLERDNDGSIIEKELLQESEEAGNAGEIEITTTNISLQNRGNITALSSAGEGGDIKLNIDKSLFLINNSEISATAGELDTPGNGGNIDIDAEFIIASDQENNDITANAFEGNGGKIDINAKAIFGIQERPLNDLTNDINADSGLGISGEVNIQQPSVDPEDSILEITPEIIDSSQLITQNVCYQIANSKFINIGKGGLPVNPNELLTEAELDVDLVDSAIFSEKIVISKDNLTIGNISKKRKPPAMGWVENEEGTVKLVAHNSDVNNQISFVKNNRGCS